MRFLSQDGRFGLQLTEGDVERLLLLCTAAAEYETGGVLFGRYSEDRIWAEVSEVTSAPSDSRSGHTWFERGTHRLQERIVRLWRESKQYYLGEWHYHPHAPPNPSSTDNTQLRRIATSTAYQCPEPVLLIVGGDPRGAWYIRAFVYLRRGGRVELFGATDDLRESENGPAPGEAENNAERRLE